MAKTARTSKDEYRYDAQLRREEKIKTEVIVQLRDQNKALWRAQRDLLASLLAAGNTLQTYREGALHNAELAIQHYEHGSCVPGCTKHVWNSVDGWHSTDEMKAAL